MAIRIVDSYGRPVKTTAQLDRLAPEDVHVFEVTRSGPLRMRASDLGDHLEVTGQRDEQAVELDMKIGDVWNLLHKRENLSEAEEKERRDKSVKVAAQRARKRVRQLSKANGVDTLLTGTYKALETDLARVKADLREFNRRVLRVLPGFGMVVAFEEQARGAWHFHAATCRIPARIAQKTSQGTVFWKSYDLLRSIWRSVTKERGGNIDVARRKGGDRTPARIASYIAKYVTKAYAEGEKWSNRWTKFGFSDVPKAVDLGTWRDAREFITAAYSLVPDAARIVSGIWSHFGDWLFLAAEASPGERSCSG